MIITRSLISEIGHAAQITGRIEAPEAELQAYIIIIIIIIIIIDIYIAHIAEASKRLETEGRVEMT